MWPNWEQLGVAKPLKVSGYARSHSGCVNSCLAAVFSQKRNDCLLRSLLSPRCITTTRGPHRRRCAQHRALTGALFLRRVAGGEEDAHCDQHKLSIVLSGVKRRAPLLFELSSHRVKPIREQNRRGGGLKGHLRA